MIPFPIPLYVCSHDFQNQGGASGEGPNKRIIARTFDLGRNILCQGTAIAVLKNSAFTPDDQLRTMLRQEGLGAKIIIVHMGECAELQEGSQELGKGQRDLGLYLCGRFRVAQDL